MKQVREQLEEHYEAQIKVLMGEIVGQKQILEVAYRQKFENEVKAQKVQLDQAKHSEQQLVKSLAEKEKEIKQLKHTISEIENSVKQDQQYLIQADQ